MKQNKAYNPKEVEDKCYKIWEDLNLFHADPFSTKPSFCLVIPPPNITGALHMGHALVNTLQDVLIRWKKMSGFETLWVPGVDHAGIATQTVVERQLIKSTGKKRKDFGRDEFLQYVWKWKEENQNRIVQQLKKMGCSCDWQRLRFTMDSGCNRAVKKIFKMLYDDGLIYRGDYLVNWDPLTQTALSDDEVEYEEKESFLWHFKYPLKDEGGYVEIATTRPETMLGDTAIAVSPKDPRYQHMIGKIVVLPLVNREITIIADHLVDPEFGTGMVKVTPAHDPNDYQMGIAHQLPFVNIMTPSGEINENGGIFQGQKMGEARENVVSAMKALGFLVKIEPHRHRVGFSYRSKAVIEPYLSKQWFIRMKGFGEKLREAITQERTRLIPKTWENTYFHWIDNLRDWCISRQLWWGHRIPIWYRRNNPEVMVCYEGEGDPPEVQREPEAWFQDEDVLDTWFSSALWPFSTLGWPEDTLELKKFYPISVMVTGHDILFFWVARMMMMGEYALKKLPFPEVFLHGLIFGKSYWRSDTHGGVQYVVDEERKRFDLGETVPKDVQFKWEKMSKTKGNIIDPLEIIEEYGTDAMRMGLCASAIQSREIDLDRRKFEEFKNFANKIWNGARFVLINLEGDTEQNLSPLTSEMLANGLEESLLNLEDCWILSLLNRTVQAIQNLLETYSFDQATMKAYDFFWKEFCAYYVEIVKPVLFGKKGTAEERQNKQKILAIVLGQVLRLIHPMAPFITEELFQILKSHFSEVQLKNNVDPYTHDLISTLQGPSCLTASYPKQIREEDMSESVEAAFSVIQDVVYTVRNIRGEMKLPLNATTDVFIVGSRKDPYFNLIETNTHIIKALVRVNQVTLDTIHPELPFASSGMVNNVKLLIPFPSDLLEKEKERLQKEKSRLEKNVEKIKAQLSNPDFLKNAPEQLVNKQKYLLDLTHKELAEVMNKLLSL